MLQWSQSYAPLTLAYLNTCVYIAFQSHFIILHMIFRVLFGFNLKVTHQLIFICEVSHILNIHFLLNTKYFFIDLDEQHPGIFQMLCFHYSKKIVTSRTKSPLFI